MRIQSSHTLSQSQPVHAWFRPVILITHLRTLVRGVTGRQGSGNPLHMTLARPNISGSLPPLQDPLASKMFPQNTRTQTRMRAHTAQPGEYQPHSARRLLGRVLQELHHLLQLLLGLITAAHIFEALH